eukprot:1918681-Rhodomonas_salina.3
MSGTCVVYCLRAYKAMSGTDVAYGATCVRVCCAMPSTEVGQVLSPTRLLCDARAARCPVLRCAMLVLGSESAGAEEQGGGGCRYRIKVGGYKFIAEYSDDLSALHTRVSMSAHAFLCLHMRVCLRLHTCMCRMSPTPCVTSHSCAYGSRLFRTDLRVRQHTTQYRLTRMHTRGRQVFLWLQEKTLFGQVTSPLPTPPLCHLTYCPTRPLRYLAYCPTPSHPILRTVLRAPYAVAWYCLGVFTYAVATRFGTESAYGATRGRCCSTLRLGSMLPTVLRACYAMSGTEIGYGTPRISFRVADLARNLLLSCLLYTSPSPRDRG